MARKSGFIYRAGQRRRETQWLDSPIGVFTTMGSAQAVLLASLTTVEKALRPFTIVRTRGWLSVRSDQQAAVENFAMGFGIAVVSDQAVAVGVTAVPTPTTDDESDAWYIHRIVQSTNVVDAGASILGLELDSRAMRKVEEGYDIAMSIENPLATGVVVSAYVRTLVKLH